MCTCGREHIHQERACPLTELHWTLACQAPPLLQSVAHTGHAELYAHTDSLGETNIATTPLHNSNSSFSAQLHNCEAESNLSLKLSVPELLFDWFGPDSITPDVLSQQASPPTPLVFRPSLLQFWPRSNVNKWNLAMDYKQLYNKVCETSLPNYLEA